MKRSFCSSCGAVLESQDKIPPLGHTVVTDPAKEPSCTQTGLTEGGHCSVCGKVLREQEVIPMLPHTEAADPGKEPTCTETGLTEGSHCAVCGEVLKAQEEIPALGHDWAEASFSKPKTCLVCGKTEGEALGAELFLNALEAGEKQAGDRAFGSDPVEVREISIVIPKNLTDIGKNAFSTSRTYYAYKDSPSAQHLIDNRIDFTEVDFSLVGDYSLRVSESKEMKFNECPDFIMKQTKFRSSDETIATVSGDGLITAYRSGTVTITAATDTAETSVTINVPSG